MTDIPADFPKPSDVEKAAHTIMVFSWESDMMRDLQSPLEAIELARAVLESVARE